MDTALRVRGLRKSYGALVAVDGVDLEVRRGETFGILGHNGAGKTSLIECSLGIRARDAGEVEILGMNPVTERKALFDLVGVQFQESGWPDAIRVGELCELGSALYSRPRDWRALCRELGLVGKEKIKAKELSGGEKQRLSILLALLPDPELLFLDELTTGLDPVARREVWSLLEGLTGKGVGIVLSSHYMDEAERLCDRVTVLKAGRIVALGSPAELAERNGVLNLEEAYLAIIGAKEVA